MAVKKSKIIGIALLLAIASAPVSGTFANGGNNLVQLDLKKSSNNSVNVTLFTSNGYNDNVMVRKKSDNKYVILIPKVQSSGYSASNLNGVRDLVSNVDVKTVNDTNGGYTKVTLITTKPLDIKTSAQKSSPVTEEQKEYKTLIAQANAVKNNIGKQETPQQKHAQKTEITVNKAVASVTQKTNKTTTQTNSAKQIDKQKNAPKIKLTEINPQAKKEKQDRQIRRAQLAELIQEVKQEKIAEHIPDKTVAPTVPASAPVVNNVPVQEVKDIKEMPKVEQPKKTSILSKIKHKAKKGLKPVGITLASLFGLIFISRLIRAIAATTKEVKASFVEQLAQNHSNSESFKYNNITDDDELSWQEKYKRYLDASAKPVPRAGNKGNYTFIKTPAEPVRKLNRKRNDLEKMVTEIAKSHTNEIQPEIVEVQNEDDAIQKAIKFKAFDSHRATLDTTSRDKIRSRFKKYENELPLHEQKNVELGKSILHSNPRKLKGANLDVADVDKNRIKYDPSDYIMSSVDEYLSILDKESEKAPQQVSIEQTPVLPAVKAIDKTEIKPIAKSQTNPITKQHSETKASYLNGLIVKSGYNIDNNKGFYIVNVDGKSALIGKVNDEVFVLKRFDSNVTNPIQVRHDNANVYMVKAGGFKSLVEVTNDKMGVLIEL